MVQLKSNLEWKMQLFLVSPNSKKYYLLSLKSETAHVIVWPSGFDILLFHWLYWRYQELQFRAQIPKVSRTKATNRAQLFTDLANS